MGCERECNVKIGLDEHGNVVQMKMKMQIVNINYKGGEDERNNNT